MIKKILTILIFFLFSLILFGCIRGEYGTPTGTQLLQKVWTDNGPFELSPERGRYALTYALVEAHSVFLPPDMGRFSLPDVGYRAGQYVSLFAPGISYLVVPGYIIGQMFDATQVGAFAVIAVFALINTILIRLIVMRLGGNSISGLLAGLTFLFATPAFAYGVNLYQHHVSTFLILLSFYLLLVSEGVLAFGAILFLFAASILVDYPNLFLLFPIVFVALKNIFSFSLHEQVIRVIVRFKYALSIVGFIIPVIGFFWFNTISYGAPLNTLGTSAITRVTDIDSSGKPVIPKVIPSLIKLQNAQVDTNAGPLSYFQTRNLLNGFYIHVLSPDRGILYFTPVVLFGIFGIIVAYRKRVKYVSVLIGVIGADLLLYSMWGDPWGGWAFGSRYMIPAYSILSIFVGIALTKFKKNWFMVGLFWLLLTYSVGVNTLGALTTSANPPEVQVLALEKLSGQRQRYSYDRNWEYLANGGSKSFFYQTFLKNTIPAETYFFVIAGTISLIGTGLALSLLLSKYGE